MNYKKIYDSLCRNAISRGLKREIGYELHHTIPKSLGGKNSLRVKLTYKEHYIAHLLLIKLAITKNELIKMTEALVWLCKSNNGKRITSSRRFEVARRKRAQAQSKFQNEKIGPNGESRAEIYSRTRAPLFARQEIYEWYHPDHGIESCNCYQLSLKYHDLNGRSTNLLKVATGLRGSCLGWVLLKNKDRDFLGEKKQKMSVAAKNRGSNGNQFYDKTGTKR